MNNKSLNHRPWRPYWWDLAFFRDGTTTTMGRKQTQWMAAIWFWNESGEQCNLNPGSERCFADQLYPKRNQLGLQSASSGLSFEGRLVGESAIHYFVHSFPISDWHEIRGLLQIFNVFSILERNWHQYSVVESPEFGAKKVFVIHGELLEPFSYNLDFNGHWCLILCFRRLLEYQVRKNWWDLFLWRFFWDFFCWKLLFFDETISGSLDASMSTFPRRILEIPMSISIDSFTYSIVRVPKNCSDLILTEEFSKFAIKMAEISSCTIALISETKQEVEASLWDRDWIGKPPWLGCYGNFRFPVPVPPGTPSFLGEPGRKEEDGHQ